MKKGIIMGAILVGTLCNAQAQSATNTKNPNPATTGTTGNSGVGNATNGSASSTGASTSSGSGAVGVDNGTSYGMQTTVPVNTTAVSDSSQRKQRKAKRNKSN